MSQLHKSQHFKPESTMSLRN